jgi:hypothetical protein
MIADMDALDATYRLQISDGDGDWYDQDQTEYTSPDDLHRLASQMYGGLKPDQYRLVQITRTVIENR